MHYYSHNIGDYRRDTAHLSILEHGAYRQLLDSYYLAEKPLTPVHADLMRTHCARSADEMQAVVNVLRDFFVLTDDGYIHKRCDIEIEAFHSKSTSASESAKARWSRVRAEKDADAMRTHSEGNANHKPITNNQEPLTSKSTSLVADAPAPKKKAAALGVDFLVFNGADEQHAADWLKARKAPLTATAWAAVEREASKAGITAAMAVQVSAENSWRGFRADWYANSRGNHGSHQQDRQRVDNSAVGRVKRAIAEGQAREAGTEPMRHFEPQDGGDLRAPLDGEFRRED